MIISGGVLADTDLEISEAPYKAKYRYDEPVQVVPEKPKVSGDG